MNQNVSVGGKRVHSIFSDIAGWWEIRRNRLGTTRLNPLGVYSYPCSCCWSDEVWVLIAKLLSSVVGV
jgi:hypothetical protein